MRTGDPKNVPPPSQGGVKGRLARSVYRELFNRLTTKVFRKQLRKNMTAAETRLWFELRAKRSGVKFRRQHGIGPFIVDFYCPEKKLVIEVDGATHSTPDELEYDAQRTSYFKKAGISVMRFTNREVFDSLDEVLNQIRNRIS